MGFGNLHCSSEKEFKQICDALLENAELNNEAFDIKQDRTTGRYRPIPSCLKREAALNPAEAEKYAKAKRYVAFIKDFFRTNFEYLLSNKKCDDILEFFENASIRGLDLGIQMGLIRYDVQDICARINKLGVENITITCNDGSVKINPIKLVDTRLFNMIIKGNVELKELSTKQLERFLFATAKDTKNASEHIDFFLVREKLLDKSSYNSIPSYEFVNLLLELLPKRKIYEENNSFVNGLWARYPALDANFPAAGGDKDTCEFYSNLCNELEHSKDHPAEYEAIRKFQCRDLPGLEQLQEANSGSAFIKLMLGMILIKKREAAKDKALQDRAITLLQAADDAGVIDAKLILADCHLRGRGVPKSRQMAIKLIMQAMDAGSARAKLLYDHLDEIDGEFLPW